MEYTKGKWTVEEWGHNLVVVPIGQENEVCLVRKQSECAKANAHLIASAPDLYEALKGLEPTLVSLSNGTTITHPTMMGYAINALQALAKAEGK